MKPKKFNEWKADEAVTKKEFDDAARKAKEDAENYSYEVHTADQKIKVKNREEALRIAAKTNGKVLELIENCGLGYIYPETK